jgi:hypothetical protein
MHGINPGNWADYVAQYPEKLRRSAPQATTANGPANAIAITTATALSLPERSKFRRLGPDEEFKDFAQREQEDIMSVGLAQPHRRGSLEPRAGEPLFEFCAAHALAAFCYDAGAQYEQALRQAKAAKGFLVPGLFPGENDGNLSQKQIEAMREASILRERKLSGLLRQIMPRAPAVMERLCFDQLPWSIYDESLIKQCLLALADGLGLIDRGINAEKPI